MRAPGRAGAEHLVKGQAVSFSGRFEPREYTTSSGEKRLALEVHDVAIEYGPKPRAAESDTGAAVATSSEVRPAYPRRRHLL